MLKLCDIQHLDSQDQPFEHEFASGEICVVLGGNQSGKTDLCRFVAGLTSKYTGEVHLDGQPLDNRTPRSVAMVFQAFVNYPNLTVRDNIGVPLRHRGLKGAQLKAQVSRYAEVLGLTEYLERLPVELSGGQQQRVAIARALAREARVLVLDEPLVNLDFKLREALNRELLTLLNETGSTVLYTSSDPKDAYLLGDQVLLLEDGNKVQSGAPISVYESPDSLAAMTILSDPQVNTWVGEAGVCALRPEDLRLSGHTDDASVEFEVWGRESSGEKTLVYGLPRDLQTDQDHWVVWLDEPLTHSDGDTCPLYFEQGKLRNFGN